MIILYVLIDNFHFVLRSSRIWNTRLSVRIGNQNVNMPTCTTPRGYSGTNDNNKQQQHDADNFLIDNFHFIL